LLLGEMPDGIKRGAFEQFWQIHPDAQANLESWYAVVRKAN
jgi:mRNA-degrading endonuclease HigB of HigAB toxin-antitoxin module